MAKKHVHPRGFAFVSAALPGVAVMAELCRHAMAGGHRHGLQGPYRSRAQYGPDRHPPAVRGNALQRRGQACRCLERRAVPLTDGQRAAFVSFAFNVRNKAFCRSTLVRKTNPGDIDGVCRAESLDKRSAAERLLGAQRLAGWGQHRIRRKLAFKTGSSPNTESASCYRNKVTAVLDHAFTQQEKYP